MSEARAMLEAEKAVEGVNPYRFHALKFIAESMAEQGDYAKAALLLADAYKSFPVNEAAKKALAEAEAAADAKERYAMYHTALRFSTSRGRRIMCRRWRMYAACRSVTLHVARQRRLPARSRIKRVLFKV